MRVFLDPGHGGSDPGASGNGITEKAKNLEVALKLRALLLAAGFDVILSRETDKTVELQQRTDYANAWPADVLLSIHHNAGGGRGIETYHSAYAAKHQADGKRLGQAVHGALIKEFAEMTNRGTKTRTFQQSPVDYYHMIREARVPSIITETGFVDNAQDAGIIKAATFVDRQARALFAGVREYFGVAASAGTPILGPAQATVGQAQAWARGRSAQQRFIDIAAAYWKYGGMTGIRPEVLYAQSAKETAFGRFGGAVTPDQNNWAGIKTKNASGDRREDHESFPTAEDGVRAHFNHICAYLGLNPIGEPHGRWLLVKSMPWAGAVRAVEELGGKWAPAADYGANIVKDYLNPLLATAPEPGLPEPEETEVVGVLKVAIVINSFIDFPTVEPLAKRLDAPIYLREGCGTLDAKTVIVAGGDAAIFRRTGVDVVDLSGDDRWLTAEKVGDYYRGL